MISRKLVTGADGNKVAWLKYSRREDRPPREGSKRKDTPEKRKVIPSTNMDRITNRPRRRNEERRTDNRGVEKRSYPRSLRMLKASLSIRPIHTVRERVNIKAIQ